MALVSVARPGQAGSGRKGTPTDGSQGKATFGYNEWNRPSSPVKPMPPVVLEEVKGAQCESRLVSSLCGTTVQRWLVAVVNTVYYGSHASICSDNRGLLSFCHFSPTFFSSPITVRFWTWFFLRKTWRIQYFLRSSVNLRRFRILESGIKTRLSVEFRTFLGFIFFTGQPWNI